MAALTVPCAWEPIDCGCTLRLTGEEADQEDVWAVEVATYVLWAMSGRQFGECELTFRPCRRDCASGLGGGSWGARLEGGRWINIPCRRCSGPCACAEVQEVRLPEAPASAVVSVVLDGEEVDEAAWRLEDGEWLVLTSGAFPDCQDMAAPLGDPGTAGVTYRYGTPVPTAGRKAAGQLACEIRKACRNDSSCRLPVRTRSVVSQGVSYTTIDAMEFLDVSEAGRTGLTEVDLFLKAANPLGRVAGARILSPDWPPRRHDAWPPAP